MAIRNSISGFPGPARSPGMSLAGDGVNNLLASSSRLQNFREFGIISSSVLIDHFAIIHKTPGPISNILLKQELCG